MYRARRIVEKKILMTIYDINLIWKSIMKKKKVYSPVGMRRRKYNVT